MFPVPRPEAADLSVLLEPVQGTVRSAVRGRRPPHQADSRAAPTSLPRQQSIREAVQVGAALQELGHVSDHVLIHSPGLQQHEEPLSRDLRCAGKQVVLGCRHSICD